MYNVMDLLTMFTDPETLHFGGVIDTIPANFSVLRQLSCLIADCDNPYGRAFDISPHLGECSRLQALTLRHLNESSGQLWPSISSSIARLTSLTALDILTWEVSGVTPTSSTFSSMLKVLELDCGLVELPPAVMGLTSLERLRVLNNSEDVSYVPPTGPHLQNLTGLMLKARPSDFTPDFLMAASALKMSALFPPENNL